MTHLLEKALAKGQHLPASEQDAIAQLILGELDDEQAWDAAFAGSQDVLTRHAANAPAEIRAGKTRPLAMAEL